MENLGTPEDNDKSNAVHNLLNQMKKTNMQYFHMTSE